MSDRYHRINGYPDVSPSISQTMTLENASMYDRAVSRLYHSRLLVDVDRCLELGGLPETHRLRLETAQLDLLNYINRDSNVRQNLLYRYELVEMI